MRNFVISCCMVALALLAAGCGKSNTANESSADEAALIGWWSTTDVLEYATDDSYATKQTIRYDFNEDHTMQVQFFHFIDNETHDGLFTYSYTGTWSYGDGKLSVEWDKSSRNISFEGSVLEEEDRIATEAQSNALLTEMENSYEMTDDYTVETLTPKILVLKSNDGEIMTFQKVR